MRHNLYAMPLLAALLATPAQAELPEPVQAMIDAAIENGDPATVRAVVSIARQTNPDDAEELDAVLAAFNEEQARLAEAEAAAADAETLAAAEDPGFFDNWSGTGQLGAFRSTGNSSNSGISAGLELTRNTDSWRHKLTAQADFQRSNGVTTREQFLFGYEPHFELSDALYVYGLGQYERDRFQGFSARYAASGGFGYGVFDTERMTLNLQGGPAWRRTDFTDGTSERDLSGYLSADFDWQVLETLKFTQDLRTFLQSENSTISSNTGIQTRFAENFSLGLSYSVEIDTDPPVGAVKTDTLSRVTLIYDF